MVNKYKYTSGEIVLAIRDEDNRGSLTLIAAFLGCTEQTIRNYAKRSKRIARELKAAQEDRRVRLFDLAEDGLELALLDENWQVRWRAIAYVLSTLGRSFYGKQLVVDADGQLVIQVSQQAMDMLAELGIETEDIAARFDRIIQAYAAEMVEVADDD